MQLLLAQGAEYLVHCGDVGGPRVLDQLAGHPALFVFGNNDWDRRELARYAHDIGIICGQERGELSFNGKLLVVTHGDDERLMKTVIADQLADYLLVGHTHQPMDQRKGRVRIINPGALYRAAEKTVAVLDTATDAVKMLSLPKHV